MHLERLDLTPEQEKSVEALLDQRRDELRTAHDRMRDARRSLHELAEDPASDRKAVERAAGELGEAEAAVTLGRVSFMRDVRALLTPEQLQELESMRDEVRSRRFHDDPPPARDGDCCPCR
jgi:Spy/CpxP family protein refolding chaperone